MNKVESIFKDVVSKLKPLDKKAYRELGEATGVDRTTISKIARGLNSNPTKDVLNKLHNELCSGDSELLSQGRAQASLLEMKDANNPEKAA